MNKISNARGYRRQLLASASTAALIFSVYAGNTAAADADRAPLWIELGWHYEDIKGQGDVFNPPFSDVYAPAGLVPVTEIERRMGYGYGGEGKISFQPDESNWIFSAAAIFGRAKGGGRFHEQTHPVSPVVYNGALLNVVGAKNEDTRVSNSETHAILDFQAGRDVGMGLFGSQGTSALSVGLRFAQFHSKFGADLAVDPNFHFSKYHYFPGLHKSVPVGQRLHGHLATASAQREFHGLGPEISWNSSAAMAGNPEKGEVTLDWGANASLLFGRQKTHTHHQSGGYKACFLFGCHTTYQGNYARYQSEYQNPPVDHARVRTVMVPNLGGSAALSVRYADAKISLGYRADFFFGAIDGGFDARKSTTRGFYGPFASISVGMGD